MALRGGRRVRSFGIRKGQEPRLRIHVTFLRTRRSSRRWRDRVVKCLQTMVVLGVMERRTQRSAAPPAALIAAHSVLLQPRYYAAPGLIHVVADVHGTRSRCRVADAGRDTAFLSETALVLDRSFFFFFP
ncbi:hypothetical protein MRX96_027705 [Rhipicephalus microplus]